MTLSLGFSTCPNDTFIFDALVHGRIDIRHYAFNVHMADVEELNQMATKGKLDVTKMSYRAFMDLSEEYFLLRSGGAMGRGCGPLIIARQPIDLQKITELTFAVPGQHTTANFLLDFVFPGIVNKKFLLFSDIEQAVTTGQVDAGVIIHENRFTYMNKGLTQVADLGAIWEQKTGAPIPLGCIACKRTLGREVALELDTLIRESVQYAFHHPQDSQPFIRQHAAEMSPEVMRAHIDLYVNAFSEDLGEEGKKGIETMASQIFQERKSIQTFFP